MTFADGRYTFVCDPHATSMHGAFVVGNPPALPRRARRDASAPKQHDLAPAGRNDGEVAGCEDATIIVVRDRSKKHNFHLTGPGVNKKTTASRSRAP